MKLWLKMGLVLSVVFLLTLLGIYVYGFNQCKQLGLSETTTFGGVCLFNLPPPLEFIIYSILGGFLFGSLLGLIGTLVLKKFNKRVD